MNLKKILALSFVFTLTCYSVNHQVHAKTRAHLRGLSASKLLHGIANTCNQVSNVVVAETQKEKQQAIFGVIGSLFMLAGDIAGEEAKRNVHDNSQDAQSQTRVAEHVPMLEFDLTRSVDAVNLPLVQDLAQIKNKQKQTDQIKTLLKYEATASELINEINLILDYLTTPQEKKLVATVKSIVLETLAPRN